MIFVELGDGERVPPEHEIRGYIGRDMQYTSGGFFRGPIRRVVIEDRDDNNGNSYKYVDLFLDWKAVLSRSEWVMFRPHDGEDIENGLFALGFNLNEFKFTKNKDGTVTASIPYVGELTILKKGDNLKKDKVIDAKVSD